MSIDLHCNTPLEEDLVFCEEGVLDLLLCFGGNINSILGEEEVSDTLDQIRSRIKLFEGIKVPAIDSAIEAFLIKTTAWIETEERDYGVDEDTYEDLQDLKQELRKIVTCVQKKLTNPKEKIFDKEEPKGTRALLFYRSLVDLIKLGYTEQVNKIATRLEHFIGILGWAKLCEDLDPDEE